MAQNPKKRASDKLSLERQAWSLYENEEDAKVAKKGHTEEQILRALRQAESGTGVPDLCREHGINEVWPAGKATIIACFGGCWPW
jgi:hypothetical protein